MIIGIGVDIVNIAEVERLAGLPGGAFVKRTFTEREAEQAEKHPNRYAYLAGRFAVKEAVFKAIAHSTSDKAFDFRIVETINEPDGCPIIQAGSELRLLLNEAGAEKLHISISNEDNYAVAFCVAES